MFDLLNEFYKSAFMTEQFSNIRREFESTTKYDRLSNRKKFRKDFAKQKSYRKFRFKLWLRGLLIILITVISFLSYRVSLEHILSSETVNSGVLLTYSIMILVFAYIISATIISLFSLNSLNGLDSNFSPKVLGLMGLTSAYFLFLGIYFIYFENMLIDKMFTQNELNKFKISTILDLIRTIVVFSIAGITLKTFSKNMNNSSSKIKNNTNHNNTHKYRYRRNEHSKSNRIRKHRHKQ